MGLKRMLLRIMQEEGYQPLTFEQLAKKMGVKTKKEANRLAVQLKRLEKNGNVWKNRDARYQVSRHRDRLKGVIHGHPKGYAFLIPDDPKEGDVYINARNLRGAVHQDRVEVRLINKHPAQGWRREGEVLQIIQRRSRPLTGIFRSFGRYGMVSLDDPHIQPEVYVSRENASGSSSGDKVVVEILRWSPLHGNSEGRIIEVLGPADRPEVDVIAVMREYNLTQDFPPSVNQELSRIEKLGRKWDTLIHEEGRRDLRHSTMITIDDADAKDLDDAVSLERRQDGGCILGVHIADVGYYVKEGSALDREARKRGTSVYLVDRVLPMLPPLLSNDLCSLNPQVDRPAVSVQISMDAGGKIEDSEFFPSLIKINERMTYSEVGAIIEEGDADLRRRYQPVVPMLEDMSNLARLLKERRHRKGALDINLPEAKIKLDEEGTPLDIVTRRQGLPESIIEEFMLLCNEVIARSFYQRKIPFLFRVHEKPDAEKMKVFQEFIRTYDLSMERAPEQVRPKDLQRILEEVKGTDRERVINYIMLRSLPQARYSSSLEGHFGLATRCYTHFTSPIRRYPDLVIHRILREDLQGRLTKERLQALREQLPPIAQHASERERVAMEAERETVDIKKVHFMEGKEGSTYSAVVSGVSNMGLFVELENTVEGLIPVSTLEDDYYHVHEKQYALVGERTGRIFRLGDILGVRVERVSRQERTVTFSLVEEDRS